MGNTWYVLVSSFMAQHGPRLIITPTGSTLGGGTTVGQLTMVPLQDTHTANGVIEPDRMLMVSGALTDSSFGNVSSALFDGQTFIPYIVSTSSTGTSGSVAALFRSFSNFSFSQRRKPSRECFA